MTATADFTKAPAGSLDEVWSEMGLQQSGRERGDDERFRRVSARSLVDPFVRLRDTASSRTARCAGAIVRFVVVRPCSAIARSIVGRLGSVIAAMAAR
jgi:hypothetical protein